MKLKKGSREAKAYMARIRAMRSHKKPSVGRVKGYNDSLKRQSYKKNMVVNVRKRKTTRRKSSSSFGGARMKPLITGLAVGIGEPILDQFASKIGLGVSDDVVKIGLGYFLSGMKGFSGIPGLLGQGLMVLGARNLAAGKLDLGGLFGPATAGSGNATNNIIG